MAERLLTPQTPDREVRNSSLARHVVSLDKELYSTLSLFTQGYRRRLFPFVNGLCHFYRSMPPLLTKPLVATDGIRYNKANNTFLNSARKNDVETGHVEFSLKVMERAGVTCY